MSIKRNGEGGGEGHLSTNHFLSNIALDDGQESELSPLS